MRCIYTAVKMQEMNRNRKCQMLIVIVGILIMICAGCGADKNVPASSDASDTKKEETGNASGDSLDWQSQYDLGIRLLGEGNYQEAIIAFTAAIQIDAKKADAYIRLAEAYMGDGQLEEAVRVLENVPGDVDQPEAVQKALEDLQEQVENLLLEAMTDEDKIEYYLEKSFDPEQLPLEEPVTLFGQDISTVTMEQLQRMAEDQGWVQPDRTVKIRFFESSGVNLSSFSPTSGPVVSMGTAGQLGGNILWTADIGYDNLDLERYGRLEEYEREEMEALLGKETGFLDLCFGDSLVAVLDRLGIEDAEKLSKTVMGAEESINGYVQRSRKFESLEIGEVKSSRLFLEYRLVDGMSPSVGIIVTSYVKTTEDSGGNDNDGRTEVALCFGGPDMILYSAGYTNYAAYYAMYGTE